MHVKVDDCSGLDVAYRFSCKGSFRAYSSSHGATADAIENGSFAFSAVGIVGALAVVILRRRRQRTIEQESETDFARMPDTGVLA